MTCIYWLHVWDVVLLILAGGWLLVVDLGGDDWGDPALLCVRGNLIVRVEGKWEYVCFSYIFNMAATY